MTKNNPNEDSQISEKLDEIVKLLQDLFIVEAAGKGMSPKGIRKFLGVRGTRVSAITKYLE